MQKRKMTAGVAAAGVLAGTAGLVWLAMPAGADQSPTLPEISPEALVESMLTADSPALAGTVEVTDNLGLPMSALELTGVGASQAQLFLDGGDKRRVNLIRYGNDQSYIDNGETYWQWDSASRTASHMPAAETVEESGAESHAETALDDPAEYARNMVETLRDISSVTVDGTAAVAGRDAYELALAPGPDERTLLREVRVAVDAENRLPLRMSVFANGSSDAVFEVGFTDIDFGAPAADVFEFTPPEGATIVDMLEPAPDQEEDALPSEAYIETPADEILESRTEVIGDGWDTVVFASGSEFVLPEEGAVTGETDSISAELINEISEPIEGEWGSGRLVSTAVVNAIITDDGRIAAGAVPAQVLTDALGEQR
ncbi:LolA family protein [Actinoalloteichus hymeniacidonis]|uniref:Outer membrane lipoprotein-sorting protein n=1 Tax=Actinoalloteichus hymeniacidonis TaxID=340345 RepID=A0AAC9MWV2_9PSEU|nr:DUF2092 domain-containing protein [Actinoalloteichus hymeniacidonis]AOS61710.1 outer membrane lipoprotein-sorting protein [Actinoalloteichus hymeniacidonis]MBB5910272.1 outer membrane lipoprotein-sorting protein [Actinoalloteichus hymeniacidonis]